MILINNHTRPVFWWESEITRYLLCNRPSSASDIELVNQHGKIPCMDPEEMGHKQICLHGHFFEVGPQNVLTKSRCSLWPTLADN